MSVIQVAAAPLNCPSSTLSMPPISFLPDFAVVYSWGVETPGTSSGFTSNLDHPVRSDTLPGSSVQPFAQYSCEFLRACQGFSYPNLRSLFLSGQTPALVHWIDFSLCGTSLILAGCPLGSRAGSFYLCFLVSASHLRTIS